MKLGNNWILLRFANVEEKKKWRGRADFGLWVVLTFFS